jgi:cell wall-associated NlpC family hydrolase
MAAYNAMGINLPHGSAYLRTYYSNRPSTVVHDELRYGDVLVYPGHCAIYTGEGTTAETVGGQVGRRTIWIRDNVVVRRFLDSKPERAWERSLYASRGGRRPHKK